MDSSRLLEVAGSRSAVKALAAFQAFDAVTNVVQLGYVRQCLDDVDFPQHDRWIFPVVKTASVVGLLGGLRSPALGRTTSVGLHSYFVLAIAAHVQAKDFRRNFAAANLMLVTCAAVSSRFWRRPTTI